MRGGTKSKKTVGNHGYKPRKPLRPCVKHQRIAANALYEAGKAVAPGVTTDELDRIAHEYMLDHGAYPSTLGYLDFPKSCCVSLNEIVCHGIPDTTVIEDGDIVNIDVTAFKKWGAWGHKRHVSRR